MDVAVGGTFQATLPDPAGGLGGLVLGARVEVPYTHAIASGFQNAVLDPVAGIWTVTLDAPIAAGDYLLHWLTTDDPPALSEWIPLNAVTVLGGVGIPDFPIPDPDAVAPTTDEVASLVRTRLVDAGGHDVRTFTMDTDPNVAEVEDLVDQARDMVLGALRPTFPAAYWPTVRRAVALQTAILLEGSYRREQLGDGAVSLWRQLLQAQLDQLNRSIDQELQHQALSRGLEPTPLPPMPLTGSVYR